jgi:Stress responsive A/B Barrel Domain
MTTSGPTPLIAPIHHTVAFRLSHPSGSPDEAAFLDAALALATIPGVEDFRQFRQVSQKSDFTFFSMRFADADAYSSYNEHPVHVAFVRNRWESEVSDFQELDLVSLNSDLS